MSRTQIFSFSSVESCVSVDAELNSGVCFSTHSNGSVFAQFDVFSGSTLGFGVGRVSSVVWWKYNAIPMHTAVGCVGLALPANDLKVLRVFKVVKDFKALKRPYLRAKPNRCVQCAPTDYWLLAADNFFKVAPLRGADYQCFTSYPMLRLTAYMGLL